MLKRLDQPHEHTLGAWRGDGDLRRCHRVEYARGGRAERRRGRGTPKRRDLILAALDTTFDSLVHMEPTHREESDLFA